MGQASGTPSPTLHDVARAAGVSFKTVSNVVNKHPQVRPATRQRVLDAIQELDYRPNIAARNLRSGRSGVIGLAVPELSQSYFAQLADDVIRVAEARGLVVLVEQTGGRRDRELEVLRSARLSLTDGILFSPLGLTSEDASEASIGSPLVVLGERIFPSADHITMENEAGARAATDHLVQQGRRRIVLLGDHSDEPTGTAALRRSGYRAGLAAADIPFDEVLEVPVLTWDRAAGARTMSDFLDRGVPFDAVFAMNDDLALGAMRSLQERGQSVPNDVAVIGFDDIDDCRYSYPSLSTIDPGRRRIAETAVELLLSRIEKGRDGGEGRVVAPAFRVVQRESTTV